MFTNFITCIEAVKLENLSTSFKNDMKTKWCIYMNI